MYATIEHKANLLCSNVTYIPKDITIKSNHIFRWTLAHSPALGVHKTKVNRNIFLTMIRHFRFIVWCTIARKLRTKTTCFQNFEDFEQQLIN